MLSIRHRDFMSTGLSNNKSVYNEISDVYHAARPEYQNEMIDELVSVGPLTPESRILEIGVGTGKLTESLAKRGLQISGIELGDRMVSVARKALSQFKNVEIFQGNFNDFDFEPDSFDAVIAATSFHWLNPATRIDRIYKVLDENGVVAIFDTRHVDGGVDEFPALSQKCYKEWDTNTSNDYHIPSLEEVEKEGYRRKGEFAKHFTTLFEKSYCSDLTYTSDSYIQLLQTYSDIISMEASKRNGLLKCIENMIDTNFGGKITKSYLWQLFIAKKKEV